MIVTTIEFKVSGKKKKFKVIHNLPDVPGLRLEDAIPNWLARTDEYTAQSFCDYVESKNTGNIIRAVK